MDTVPTKVYVAQQDFVLPKVTEAGEPDGEQNFYKDTEYALPEAVAATAPVGALVEVTGNTAAPAQVVAPTSTEVPPAAPVPQQQAPVTPGATNKDPKAGWAGGHAPVGRE